MCHKVLVTISDKDCIAEGKCVHPGHKQTASRVSGDRLHGQPLPQECEKRHRVSKMAASSRIPQGAGRQCQLQVRVDIQRYFSFLN